MSSLRILIASGEEAMREVLGNILRADGCEVLAVASTDEAISQATQFGPDTLITETIMPGKIDGFRAAKCIAQSAKCKVLFLETIHPDVGDYWDGVRQEIPDCDILPTPFEKDEAIAIVHRRITGWSIAERRIAEKADCPGTHTEIEKVPEEHRAKTSISNRSQVIRVALAVILIWSAITIPFWYRSGLKGWMRTMTEIFGIYATGFLSVAVEALILGLLGLLIFFSWIIIRFLQRRNMMSDANLLKLNTALLIAVIVLLLWGSFWKPQRKPAGRFQPLGEDHFRALDTKTGKLCATVDIFTSRNTRFKDVQAPGIENSGTFAVPERWDEKHIQSYLDTYWAEDPEGFLRSGRKQFDPLFDRSTMPLPTCASLE